MAIFFVAVFVMLCLLPAAAQNTPIRQIGGRVIMSGAPAPAGFSVLLVIVTTENAARAQVPVARAVTDAEGRFIFDHLEEIGGNSGKEIFALVGRFPAYKDGVAFVDLREKLAGNVTLELEPETPVSNTSTETGAPKAAAKPGANRQLSNADARAAFARANKTLFDQHNPEGSLSDLKQVVKSDPWFAPGYLLMGLAYMQLQKWTDAQWAFEEATKVEPANPEGYLGMGSALNEQKSYAAARKPLEECLDLRVDYAEAHYELARSLSGLGKFEEAAGHARRAVEIRNDYAGPHVLLGNIYLEMEDPEAALSEFEEYVKMEPQGSLAPAAKDMITKLKKALEDK